MRTSLFMILPAVLLAAATTTTRVWAAPSAEDIAQRSFAHPLFALEGAEVKATMTLSGPGGGGGATTERRSILVQSKRVGGLLRSVTRFSAPSSIAGTGFLSIQNEGRADDQYVFLPRLKNTRRIGTGVDRDASFMGSDLSYDDLNRKSVRDATFRLLGEEALDGGSGGDLCFKIEATPRVAGGHYTKSIVWVRKSDGAPIRTDGYGATGVPLKTMRILKTGTFGTRKVVTELSAEDMKTHHRTVLTIDDVKDGQFSDSDFTPAALSR